MHSAPVRNAVLCAWGINANTCDVSWNTANKISTTSSRKISSAYFRETLADHLSVGTMEYGSSMVLLPGETIIARSTSPQWDLLMLVVSFVMAEWLQIIFQWMRIGFIISEIIGWISSIAGSECPRNYLNDFVSALVPWRSFPQTYKFYLKYRDRQKDVAVC